MAQHNPNSLQDTLRAAALDSERSGDTHYVFATGLGWVIHHEPPAFQQKHYIVTPENITRWEKDLVTGEVSEIIAITAPYA